MMPYAITWWVNQIIGDTSSKKRYVKKTQNDFANWHVDKNQFQISKNKIHSKVSCSASLLTPKLKIHSQSATYISLLCRDTVISPEEAEQLMCPPSPNNGDHLENETSNSKNPHQRLTRMNSYHVGPVQLPHPVRMPNGRIRTYSKIRSCSEDHSSNSKHINFPSRLCDDDSPVASEYLYTGPFAVFLICRRQTANLLDWLVARQTTTVLDSPPRTNKLFSPNPKICKIRVLG